MYTVLVLRLYKKPDAPCWLLSMVLRCLVHAWQRGQVEGALVNRWMMLCAYVVMGGVGEDHRDLTGM